MKAAVYTTKGTPDVLQPGEIAKPSFQQSDMLVPVQAASLHDGGAELTPGKPFLLRLMGYGLLKPKNATPGDRYSRPG